MAVKFSAFTTRTGTLDASTKIVGYDDPAGTKTNVEFSLATLAANSGIYAADGTIGTTRKALITDTIQFRNAGDTSDILKLNTDGTFSLGDGASSTLATQVAIGRNAAVGSSNAVAIGNNATASYSNSVAIGNSAGATYDSISIGSSSSSGSNGISMGQSSAATGNGVAIGYDAEAPASSIGLGANAKGSGANSITLNANGSAVTPGNNNAFYAYMSNNTTPDFAVHHDGNSYIAGTGLFGINKSNPLATLDVVHYHATRKLVSFNNNSATEVFSLENNEGRIGPDGNNAWKLGIGVAATADAKVKILHGTYHDVGLRITGRSGIDAYKPLQIHDGTNVELFSVTSAGTVKVTGQAYTALYANATNLVVDWNESNVQTVTVNSSTPTFAPTNPRAGATYILIIEQGATPVTVDWNSLVKWPGGSPPTLSSATGKIDVITLICYDEGNNYYYGSATLDLA